MTLIKSISGIRGTIGGDIGNSLTPNDVVSFTAAYAVWIKSKKEGLEFEKFLNYFSHDINLIRYFFGNNFKVNGILKRNCGNIYFDYKHFYGTFEFIYSKNNKKGNNNGTRSK